MAGFIHSERAHGTATAAEVAYGAWQLTARVLDRPALVFLDSYLVFLVSLSAREPPEPSNDGQKANRWAVAGLDRFLGSYGRASAAGVGYGAGECTAGVLDGSWWVFATSTRFAAQFVCQRPSKTEQRRPKKENR